jgi:hypothetical protein
MKPPEQLIGAIKNVFKKIGDSKTKRMWSPEEEVCGTVVVWLEIENNFIKFIC